MSFLRVTPPNKACMRCGKVIRFMYEMKADGDHDLLGPVEVDAVEKQINGSHFIGYIRHECETDIVVTHLAKCADRSLTLNSGACGYGENAIEGDPAIADKISFMLDLTKQGLLTCSQTPTGASRTFSPQDFTFTLTEKGKQLLRENRDEIAIV